MKVKLKQMYLSQPAGAIMDVGHGVAVLLIQRGVAEEWKDPDQDGIAEGGKQGAKKAFSKPPATKGKKR
jgi:hypothetical protein